MILIFGGTREGRTAVSVCDVANKAFYYSTKGSEQVVDAVNMQHLTGAMNGSDIIAFCKSNDIKLIIDAAHPFANVLHQNIAEAAAELAIPNIRFERLSTEVPASALVRWFDSIEESVDYLVKNGIDNLLALTGVKSAASLLEYSRDHSVVLRIMDRAESHEIIEQCGFPKDNVIYYDDNSDDYELISQLSPSAILTKESGESGGFDRKLAIAKSLAIPLLVVKRPLLQQSTATVYGEHGLRKQIERFLPDFIGLRTGFTTGSSATAAAAAAVIALLEGRIRESVFIDLPSREPLEIELSDTFLQDDYAVCTVVKDAGDDPDVTHKMEIKAEVRLKDSKITHIDLRGGEGIGIVTLPGLGIPIGEAAINEVPRRMIEENIRKLLKRHGVSKAVEIIISAPKGESVALKTFNPRLGIIGGISILGTSGIVRPFSSEAFLESIHRQIFIVKALSHNCIIINSGAKSERFIKQEFPDHSPHVYIHYGNLVGATIELAASEGIKRVILGVMIGKAVKLAEGSTDTHSKKGVMNRDFLCSLAQEVGCAPETIAAIAKLSTARQLWDIIPLCERAIFTLIAKRCYEVCKPLLPDGELELLLLDELGAVVARV